MILAFDTYYFDNKAKTVCVSFNKITDAEPTEIKDEIIKDVPEYEPGSFYKRELPCILSLLKKYNLEEVELIIVDGYAILNNEGKLGLGGYLYEELNKTIPVIGVAKSQFNVENKFAKELFRGESKKPLYVSAIGLDLKEAYNAIKDMDGNYRMPTLLKVLDTKTRE
ncbi:Deoxyinosine 3'endonuclease (Endonuclease V)-like protein [Tenacibaculum jejuense]|uniref:Deoxyinosine 3'endonuclease (Endonuclease V)-like protein n=2 Tax=Tenacibaculum jejuense TaxID=584609 RepID=A0A238UE16_9FLAO|nr:Deoxyinosine 3'endonuclease (Endonuclease V)-like protein [Tenacibaculum jejuense]